MNDSERRVAWIETIDEQDATGDVADAYRRCGDKRTGNVDHIMKVHSLHPRSMLDHQRLYGTLMYGQSPLSRVQREMIATVVSAINRCVY